MNHFPHGPEIRSQGEGSLFCFVANRETFVTTHGPHLKSSPLPLLGKNLASLPGKKILLGRKTWTIREQQEYTLCGSGS